MIPQVKIIKSKDTYEKFSKNLEDNIGLRNVQSYFPVMSIFFDYYNTNESPKFFNFDSKYQIIDILDKIKEKNEDIYIKHMYKCNLLDKVNHNEFNTIETECFVKINPILNVLSFINNSYNVTTPQGLPNIFNYITNKKINSYHNTSYIDCFFTHLGSLLVEKGKTTIFPLFYGQYSGIIDDYKFDI
jgi:hypothetical protein